MLSWLGEDLRKHEVDSPRLDAELMVAEALGMARIGLYLDLDRPLTTEECESVRGQLRRRRQREPMAYILGRREFWGRSFHVEASVLVPRPETEQLVERGLACLARQSVSAPRVLDLGTGSGAIAITLACEVPQCSVDAVDISEEALAVAEKNAVAHGVASRVHLQKWDAFGAASSMPPAKQANLEAYALICSNPPYIPDAAIAELAPEVARFEPRLALAGGIDGMQAYRAIAQRYLPWLAGDGSLVMEVGQGQASEVAAMLKQKMPALRITIEEDLAGIPRIVEATRQALRASP